MKYIKPFNESFENEKKIEELKDFCESNLVYLLDEDCIINYGYRDSKNQPTANGFVVNVGISLVKKYDPINKDLKWSDIKDYYISFIDRLLNKYNLVLLYKDQQEFIQFIYRKRQEDFHRHSINVKDIRKLDQFDDIQFDSISIIVKLK